MTSPTYGKVSRNKADLEYNRLHNCLLGQTRRAQTTMQAIYDSTTTTDECRSLAAKIEGQLNVLYGKLKIRRDQELKQRRHP